MSSLNIRETPAQPTARPNFGSAVLSVLQHRSAPQRELRALSTVVQGSLRSKGASATLLNVALCSSILVGAASAQSPTSGSAVITLPNERVGPYFNLVLPNTIYQRSRDAALSDLRIRNAQGEFLNYAWHDEYSMSHANIAPTLTSKAVPIFPLAMQAKAAALNETSITTLLEKKSDGSLRLKTNIRPLTTSSNSIEAWIIDASSFAVVSPSQAARQLLQLRLRIPAKYQGVAGFELDASDDLQHWNTIENFAQLVQLKHQGELVEHLAFPLALAQQYSENPARYLRLRWHTPSVAPVLKSAEIDAQEQANQATPRQLQLQWHTAISPLSCDTHVCEYSVPPNTPIDSLRIGLNERNTLAKIRVTALREELQTSPQATRNPLRPTRNPLYHLRHKNPAKPASETAEYLIADSTVYRLQRGETELISSDIPLSGDTYSKIKLHVARGVASLGSKPPTIAIANVARSLTFLARGAAPYTLQWGETSQLGAALTRTELMPDTRLDDKEYAWASIDFTSAPPAPSTATSSNTAPQEKPNRVWLWLALCAALALLAAMVFSLLKNVDKERG